MNWLISYNHSGNSWVRYCIEYLTQLPTHGHQAFSMSQRCNNFLNVDLSKEPIVTKRHKIELSEISHDDKLILLIRDPNDAIKEYLDVHKEFDKYYKLVKIYNDFDGDKLIVKYNSLFEANNIKQIVDFYDLELKKDFNNFKNRFEYHQNKSRSVYHNSVFQQVVDLDFFIDKELLKYVYKYL